MGTVIETNPEYRDRVNSEYSILAQVVAAQDLSENRLDQLYWTVSSSSGIYDPTADQMLVSWLAANGTFKPFEGEPVYRTLERFWSHVSSQEYSAHYRMSDRERKTILGSQAWDQLAGIAGRGDAAAQRRTLVRLMATSDLVPCFDQQNLADTDHPGIRYDSATDAEIALSQANYFNTTWNPTTIETVVQAATSYHDTAGNHYGNKFDERSRDLPTTNDLRTQAPKPPQFHVWAGTDSIGRVQAEARTWDNTASKYAGSYSYDKVEELPPKRIVGLWLNTRMTLPGVPMEATLPYLRKWDGTQVFVTADGESLDNRRFRQNYVDAHGDHGFAANMWHRLFIVDEP